MPIINSPGASSGKFLARQADGEPRRIGLRILAIETSGRTASVALVDASGGAPATLMHHTPPGERTARALLPTLAKLLDEAGWRVADVDIIGVTTGPGSFTGLRIGVVAAKTLAYACQTPLVGVHTLAAIAAGAGATAQRLWTVLDAQRQELFVASFPAGPAIEGLASPPTEIISRDEWLRRVSPGDAVAGPPLAQLQASLPAGVLTVDPARWHPSAAVVAELAQQLQEHGGEISPLELVPRYYRKSAAEEKAAARLIERESK
jgi:tRNA threonylcarbamoyladenosine biosynthesis protein TsaB